MNPIPAGIVRKDSTSQHEIRQQLKEMETAASVSMNLQDFSHNSSDDAIHVLCRGGHSKLPLDVDG